MDYLLSNRIAIIQKSKLPLQLRIQRIANQAVDEKILYYYDETDIENYTVPSFKEEVLLAMVGRENLLATSADFQRLMKNSIITPNHITKLEQLNATRQISDRITKVEVERINKNLQYIEHTLQNADVNIDVYKNLIQKLPRQVSRQDILKKALEKGSNYKGREYSYRELKNISRDLERYKDNHSRYEVGMIENRQASREGMRPINTEKVWVWSELEDTRHHKMSGQTVRFTEKFEVVNEKTGTIDHLRFPQDIENDTTNCSNTCNCCCSYFIQ